jgi:hypothetical protein
MELLALYLWLKLDAISGLLFVVAALSAIAAAGCAIYGIPNDWTGAAVREAEARARRFAVKVLLPVFGASALLLVILPSTKDAAILAGAHFAIQAAESPEGRKVASLLRQRINAYLDEQLAEQVKGAK